MTVADRRGEQRLVSAFLSYAFRPFFLMAGLWSAAALLLWIAIFMLGVTLPSRLDSLSWHIHEMLFGFAMATIAGFLLTAIANWTRRSPVSGAPLALLAALWLLGRVCCLISGFLPAWLAAAGDLAFPVVLTGVVGREIIAGRNWRNLPMIAALVVLGSANLLMHIDAAGVEGISGLGWRLGLAAVIALISVVGGRIVPSFTRNWLAKRQVQNVPPTPGKIDRAALGTLHAGLFAWALAPDFSPIGLLLLAGAVLNFWRLLQWQGHATVPEPLLLVLHIGYAWMVFGAAWLGLSMLDPEIPLSAAVHALTTGAIGTMTLAVMTRATRGHTGRELSADFVTSAIYVIVSVAAMMRVAAVFALSWSIPLLVASACLWAAAFMAFVLCYAPMLLQPAKDL